MVVRLGDASNQEGGAGAPCSQTVGRARTRRPFGPTCASSAAELPGSHWRWKLADSPLQVVVLEGGGLTPDPTDEGGYQILSDRGFRLGNDPLLPWYFGGKTNHGEATAARSKSPTSTAGRSPGRS